jgi:NADH-quinone oxidoreductase subunit C
MTSEPPAPTAPGGAGAAKPAPAKPAAKAEAKAPPAPPLPPDPPPPDDQPRPDWLAALESDLPGAVSQLVFFVGDWTLVTTPDRLLALLRWLRDAEGARFDFLSDLTATDWPARAERFDVVYCLYSVPRRDRVRVKVRVADGGHVPSVTALWPAANWFEREVFDMFGVRFAGHPDLRRILMPDQWEGHPQRKDYPLEGPGELLLENPVDWLKVRQQTTGADFE